MSGCVLRVSGRFDELSRSLAHAFVRFTESRQSARRRERGEASESDEATFNCTVSESDGDHVPQQILDAEAFVSEHGASLAALWTMRGVESCVLDLGWEIPHDTPGRWSRFPSTLLSLCAAARLDNEVSVYVVAAPGL